MAEYRSALGLGLLVITAMVSGCISSRGGNSRGGGDDDDAGSDDDDADDDDEAPDPESDIELRVEWPFLEMVGDGLVFPTYLAHLIGSSVDTPWWRGTFSVVRIENAGDRPETVEVTSELRGYSSPGTRLIELEPGETVELDLSPQPTLDALYALDSETNAEARIEARGSRRS